MTRLLAVALFCLATFGFAAPAYSIPVTFDFTVRVEYVLSGHAVDLGIEAGSLLVGSMTYESTTPPQTTSPPGVAEYLLGGSVHVSGGSFALTTTPYLLTVENDVSQADALRVRDTATGYDLSIDIVSSDLGTLSSVDLPTVPPDVSSLSFELRRFIYSNQFGQGIFAHIETMTLPAPEPAVDVLMALALAGVLSWLGLSGPASASTCIRPSRRRRTLRWAARRTSAPSEAQRYLHTGFP